MNKSRLREIVEDNTTKAGRAFDCVSQMLVLASLVAFTIETRRDLSAENAEILRLIEIVTVGLFTIEYALRVFVAENKLRFIFSFFGIVDLAAILPFYLCAGIDLRSIRILRVFRLLRALKLARYNDAAVLLRDSLIRVRAELTLFFSVTIAMLYISAVGIFYCECEAQPDKFSSVLDSLWWAVVTLTTIGYGDMYPVTAGGKIFTSVISLLGIGIIAVPTGLITSAMIAGKQNRESRGE